MAKTKFKCGPTQNEGCFITSEGRLSFPYLAKPKQNDSGDDRYGLSFLFPAGADVSALEEAAEAAGKEKWGKDWPKVRKRSNFKWPFRDQGEKSDQYEGYEEGAIFFNCNSTKCPPVIDGKMSPVSDLASEVYGGRRARVEVRFYAFDKKGGIGIGVGLQCVQLLKGGEQLGGGTSDPTKAFTPVEEDDEDEDDESPF